MTHPTRALGLLAASLLLAGCCARTRCPAPCAPVSPCAPVPAARAPAAATAEAPERHVFVDSSIFRIPAAKAEEVLGVERGRAGRAMELLEPAAAAALEERLAQEPGVSVVHQPKILAVSGQDATIFVGEQYDTELQRPAGHEAHDAALADGAWSGTEVRLEPTVLPESGYLSLDLGFIHRERPPEGTKPDPVALVAQQVHGRMGVARMADGHTAAILIASADPAAPGDRLLLLATPRILPARGSSTTR